MKQIYNLLETIEQDKESVAKLKKQLHHAESVLEAHIEALTRLTTIPESPQPELKKVDYSAAVEKKERITRENWKDLGIEEGDMVEIVTSGNISTEEDTYIIDILDHGDSDAFLGLKDNGWYWYGEDGQEDDELYLIRTEEGSLND